MTEFEVRRLGLMPYQAAWALQQQLAEQRAADLISDTLLLLEHPHTFTFGRSGKAEHLIWSELQLRARGVTVEWVDRGGDVTYHGPGQLVGYPILRLGQPNSAEGRIPQADYVGYVRKLEEVIIRTLAQFGLVSGQLRGLTGVWIQPDVASRCPHCPPAAKLTPSKIAAIGVKVNARGISQHGFALNIAPEMTYFNGIIPCGIPDHGVISLADLFDDPPAMDEVIDELCAQFAKVFSSRLLAPRPDPTGEGGLTT